MTGWPIDSVEMECTAAEHAGLCLAAKETAAARFAPREPVVRIDPERHAQTSGTGADSASKPSRCNACQSWSGMGVSSHSMFLLN